METIGIDVQKAATQDCILNEHGEFREFRVRTEHDSSVAEPNFAPMYGTGSREVLVQMRSRILSLCRALLRQEGIRVRSGCAVSFVKRVRALDLGAELARTLQPLLQTDEHV